MAPRRHYHSDSDDDDESDEEMFRVEGHPTRQQLGWRDSPSLAHGALDLYDPEYGRSASQRGGYDSEDEGSKRLSLFLALANRADSSSRPSSIYDDVSAPPSYTSLESPGIGRFFDAAASAHSGPSRSSRRNAAAELPDFPDEPSSPYAVLGVSRHATQSEIKSAYKARALRYHPDRLTRNAGREERELAKKRFQWVGEAFAILGDPQRRAEYDRAKSATAQAASSSGTPRANTARAPSSSTSAAHAAAAPSFTSTFMPQNRSTRHRTSSSSSKKSASKQDDLRDIDPFYLFEAIVGDMMDAFEDLDDNDWGDLWKKREKKHNKGSHRSRGKANDGEGWGHEEHRSARSSGATGWYDVQGSDAGEDVKTQRGSSRNLVSPFDRMSELLDNPIFGSSRSRHNQAHSRFEAFASPTPSFTASSGSANGKKSRKGTSAPYNMNESHQSAHVGRDGALNVNKSEKRIEVDQSGGLLYQSSSFSGSFGGMSSSSGAREKRAGRDDLLEQFLSSGSMLPPIMQESSQLGSVSLGYRPSRFGQGRVPDRSSEGEAMMVGMMATMAGAGGMSGGYWR